MNQKKENSRASSGSKSSLKKVLNIFSIKYTTLIFCAVFLFFGLAGVNKADAAISLVNNSTNYTYGNGAQGVSTTLSITTGNLIAVGCGSNDSTAIASTTVTDSAGNTFILATSTGDNNFHNAIGMFYAKNAIGNASDTITCNVNATSYMSINVLQFSGLSTTSPLDVAASTQGSAGTSITSNTFSTSQANEVIVAFSTVQSAAPTTFTQGSGYTSPFPATNTEEGGEYQIVSSTQTNTTASMSWVGYEGLPMMAVGTFSANNSSDTTPPTVTAFTMPSTANSEIVNVNSFTATDNVAVTGYLITTTSSTPSTSNPNWTSTAPTAFTFSGSGSQTAYAWAKDAAGNVSTSLSATVTITLTTYTIGGTISGLIGTVVLQNNGGDNLSKSANGSFTFATAINNGSNYIVTVLTQPSGQACSVSNGSGTVSSANVTNVAVSCVSTHTYYVDYASGSDSNNGTSKSTPWQHAPGMQTCTSLCNSTTINAGDSIILKGGVTWPNASFMWNLPGGSTSNSVYVGVDKTWYTGGSFSRPILNAGGTVVSNNYDTMFNVPANVTIDDFEITGFYWTTAACSGAPYGDCGVFNAGQRNNQTFENLYVHGWTHAGTNGATSNGVVDIFSFGGAGNTIAHDNVIVGTDVSGDHSVTVFFDGPSIAYNNYIKQVSSAFITSNSTSIHDNHIEDIGPAYCNMPFPQYAGNCTHENGFEDNADEGLNFYNNVISNVSAGLALWIAPNPGYTADMWNNLIYAVHDNQILDFAQPVYNSTYCSTGENGQSYCNNSGNYIFNNNTVEYGDDSTLNNVSVGFTAGQSFLFKNNHFIALSSTGGCAGGLSNCTFSSSNIIQTLSTANTQGYTSGQTYAFSPTSGGSTIGAGTNLTSSCSGNLTSLCSDTTIGVGLNTTSYTTIVPGRTTNTRPTSGVWDVGAYEYASTATTITSFNLTTPAATGVVNNTNHTVAITVPSGTTVTSLTPTIVLTVGETISPNTGVAHDFTNPVTYTVTAQDGVTQQAYTVTVTAASGLTSTGYHGCQPGGTCYYISYSTGSDSNDGLSETNTGGGHGPWKYPPFDEQQATGNSAAHTPASTDEYIFRGEVIPTPTGTVQPSSYGGYQGGFWYLATGNATAPSGNNYPGLYIGYDPSWNDGTVKSVRETFPGYSCSSAPTVVFTNASGDTTGGGAAATATIGSENWNLGDVIGITMTNSGANYTKNPIVSFVGGGCVNSPTAVTSIQAPVLDGSSSTFGTSASVYPMFEILHSDYMTLDGFEFRNYHWAQGYNTGGGGAGMVSVHYSTYGHFVVRNNYFHGFGVTSTIACDSNCQSSGQNASDEASTAMLGMGYETGDTNTGNWFSNYEASTWGSLGNGCDATYHTSADLCSQGVGSNGSGAIISNNYYSNLRGGFYFNGDPAVGMQISGNNLFDFDYDSDNQHGDVSYGAANGAFYNNKMWDNQGGAGTIYEETNLGNSPTETGLTMYFFNNVCYNTSQGGSQCPSMTTEFNPTTVTSVNPLPSFYILNNTVSLDGLVNNGAGGCFGAGQWFGDAPSLVRGLSPASGTYPWNFSVHNNFCVTNPSSSNNGFLAIDAASAVNNGVACPVGGCGTWNGVLGGVASSAVTSANQVSTISSADSEGYSFANEYVPISNTNDTVTYASSGNSVNYTSLCSTSVDGVSLSPLCADINGNARPTTGGWQAGAYQYLGSSPTYTIGGTISGLSGTVVLQDNGGDNLSKSANGSFTFATALNNGATYA
ncbi:MAG: DUF5018 domain-containing protein, partial [Candidatus Pacebacteria bacterium]|nr:DUF5018 domain-containing protein [Candidatus Paceibacterota bacterium]